MSLEAKYRRRMRLFPRAWRNEHEDELVGVFLDGAEVGQRSVPVGDSIDLAVSAAKIRGRRWSRRLRSQRLRSRSGMLGAALAALTVATAMAVVGSGGSVPPEFFISSLIVVLIPGTGAAYTVTNAIGGGWQRGFVAALGCTLSIVPHIIAAMVGLSGVMRAGSAAYETVRWVGVAYLVFMGVSMLRSGGTLALDDDIEPTERRFGVIVQRGILINVLNPKLTVFFFAFFPQFLNNTPRPFDPQFALLGAVFMAMTLVVFLCYAAASAAVRDRVLRSPRVMDRIQRTVGALFVGFAARLAVAE